MNAGASFSESASWAMSAAHSAGASWEHSWMFCWWSMMWWMSEHRSSASAEWMRSSVSVAGGPTAVENKRMSSSL